MPTTASLISENVLRRQLGLLPPPTEVDRSMGRAESRPLRETAALTDQVRCISALFTMHAGMFVLRDVEGDPEDKRRAVLEVAIDLVTQAHTGTPGV